MPYSFRYIPGNRLVKCDVCGFDYRFSDMRRGVSGSQKGFIVCPPDFDPIHPRDISLNLRKKRPMREVQ